MILWIDDNLGILFLSGLTDQELLTLQSHIQQGLILESEIMNKVLVLPSEIIQQLSWMGYAEFATTTSIISVPDTDLLTFTGDKFAEFNGTSSVISVTDTDLLTFGDGSNDSPFTMMGWLYPYPPNPFKMMSKVSESDGEYSYNLDTILYTPVLKLYDATGTSIYIGQ
jgi:hypothetical protein